MLAADVRQSIELFFYYYANGTLAWAELNATEYRAVTASNPELFWKSCAIFIHHLLNKDENPEYGAARWLKAQLTGTPVIRSTDAQPAYCFSREGLKLPEVFTDFTYKLAHNQLTHPSLKQEPFFETIMEIGDSSFLQLIACVWNNNLRVDDKGVVLNKTYAEKRVNEYIALCEKGIEPDQAFEAWETEHNT